MKKAANDIENIENRPKSCGVYLITDVCRIRLLREGCDSPIELFLLQAMHHQQLKPKIQTYIFSDGTTFPTLQAMWQEGKKTKSLSKIITEADFYFDNKKIAIFCDSVAHHSSEEVKAKDQSIDEKLEMIGIASIRLTGTEIMASPLECSRKILKLVESR